MSETRAVNDYSYVEITGKEAAVLVAVQRYRQVRQFQARAKEHLENAKSLYESYCADAAVARAKLVEATNDYLATRDEPWEKAFADSPWEDAFADYPETGGSDE